MSAQIILPFSIVTEISMGPFRPSPVPFQVPSEYETLLFGLMIKASGRLRRRKSIYANAVMKNAALQQPSSRLHKLTAGKSSISIR